MRTKSFHHFKRRSSFEICLEIIELCNHPGLPLSRLMTRANLNHTKIKHILFKLIEDKLIETETRPRSFTGQKRDTDYFIRTREGDWILKEHSMGSQRTASEGTPLQSRSMQSRA